MLCIIAQGGGAEDTSPGIILVDKLREHAQAEPYGANLAQTRGHLNGTHPLPVLGTFLLFCF